jgi:myo-inositol-1(or 4)-monophosphatase
MSDAAADRAAAAEEIARAAGVLALDFFAHRTELSVESKLNAQDMVTRADREVEALIRARVIKRFPDDGFLGEELGSAPGSSGFTWAIDPIDGTTPFLFGLSDWCVSIALRAGGQTIAGAIAAPTRGELFAARRGGGARLNGEVLRIPSGLTILNGLVAIGANHRVPPGPTARVIERLLAAGGMFYRNGSGALMLAQVAAGRLAAYWEAHMNAWDALAGLLVVEEAGGRCAPYCENLDIASGDAVLAAAPDAWCGMRSVLAE